MSITAIPPLEKKAAKTATAVLEPLDLPSPEVVPAMSTEALMTLVAQLLVQQQKQTEAIIELSKPREPLKTKAQLAAEANEKLFDERAKEQRRRQKETQAFEQSSCEHIAGCSSLSEQHDIANRSSILWHRNDVGVDVGICTVCQKFFYPSDPPDAQGHTYAYWRKKTSFNKMSMAGFRTILDPVRAREESYLHDS